MEESTGKLYSFRLPRKILFGVGSFKRLGVEAESLGGRKLLLVTDRNLIRIGLAEEARIMLEERGFLVEVYGEVEAEPRIENAERIAEKAREGGFDLVVGVGGGSVMDMAKVASIAVTNPGSMRSYVGVGFVRKPGIPKILVPTTAGTGSEVTDVAVVTLPEEKVKTAIISPYMLGDTAIVDPKLTYTMPPKLTASTGVDALSHALEAMMSVNSNLITDALALEAVRLIFKHLREAYRSGSPESRYGMSLAALTAGMAFSNTGVCLAHALAYTFAVSHHTPHGVSCGLALPYAFKFNASAISQKLPRIAEAMELRASEEDEDRIGEVIVEAILNLLKDVGLPRRLRELGIPREELPTMADRLLSMKRLLSRNPRPVTEGDALKLVNEMW